MTDPNIPALKRLYQGWHGVCLLLDVLDLLGPLAPVEMSHDGAIQALALMGVVEETTARTPIAWLRAIAPAFLNTTSKRAKRLFDSACLELARAHEPYPADPPPLTRGDRKRHLEEDLAYSRKGPQLSLAEVMQELSTPRA